MINLDSSSEIDPSSNKQQPSKSKWAKFNYKDALNLEGLLTEEEIMVRDQFHDYCQEKLMPRIMLANRNEGNPFIYLFFFLMQVFLVCL